MNATGPALAQFYPTRCTSPFHIKEEGTIHSSKHVSIWIDICGYLMN